MVRDMVLAIFLDIPLTHQRNGARRRHLIELLLVQREGMSELSHGEHRASIDDCGIEKILLRKGRTYRDEDACET
jgi:hypothetical protein